MIWTEHYRYAKHAIATYTKLVGYDDRLLLALTKMIDVTDSIINFCNPTQDLMAIYNSLINPIIDKVSPNSDRKHDAEYPIKIAYLKRVLHSSPTIRIDEL